MSSVLRKCLSLILLLPILVLTACGSSDDPSEPSATVSAPSASAGTSNPQDTARVRLQQCLREQGLDVPDTEGHGAFAALSPADRQKLEAALEGPCREYRTGAFADIEEDQSTEMLDAITAFTTCLRESGVDVPDPDPANPFAVLHTLDQSNPRVAKASSKCQDELAVLNGGG